MPNQKWLQKISGDSGEKEKIRLFCLPHAGSGTMTYTPWKNSLRPEIGLYAICLPGRERRIREPLIDDVDDLCDRMLDGIAPELKPPYVLLGHSMGGILAYELVRRLVRRGLPLPEQVIFSGTSLIGFESVPNVDRMNDAELADYMRNMGGTEEELLTNSAFRACYFPIIRNDYRLVRRYRLEPEPIPVPCVALAGDADVQAPVEKLLYFQKLTTGFRLYIVEGGHFFIESPDRVCPILNSELLGDVFSGHGVSNIKLNYDSLKAEKKTELLKQLSEAGGRFGIFPLTDLQNSLLFHYMTRPADTSYHIRFIARFSSQTNPVRLEAALRTVVRRNPTLRTRLLILGEACFQMVDGYQRRPMPLIGCETAAEVRADFDRQSDAFDLEQTYPFRFQFYRTADTGDWFLTVCFHHMFGDGRSAEVLAEELRQAYEAADDAEARGQTAALLPVKPVHSRCFWTDDRAECEDFWARRLAAFPEPVRFPGEQINDGAAFLPSDRRSLTRPLKGADAVAAHYQVSRFCLGLGLYLQALTAWIGREVTVGVPVLNRHNRDQMADIGLYANTLPVRSRRFAGVVLADQIGLLQHEIRSMTDNSAISAAKLQRLMGVFDGTGGTEMYRMVFLTSETDCRGVSFGAGEMVLEQTDNSDQLQFDLLCMLEHGRAGCSIRFDYRAAVLSDAEAARLADLYLTAYEAAAAGRAFDPPEDLRRQIRASDRPRLCVRPIVQKTERADAAAAYDAELIERIRLVWTELLGHDRFTDDDNFFRIGGNSLLCIKLADRISRLQIRPIRVTDIFKYYTVRGQADFLNRPPTDAAVNHF